MIGRPGHPDGATGSQGHAGAGGTGFPIPWRILALRQEQNRLFACPIEDLAAAIRDTGFRCTCCGACCTQAVGSSIFLLDRDVEALHSIDPCACEPAPGPEFCDQNGVLYYSGYALRMRDGRCPFLAGTRCSIYEQRFSTCRVYPFTLRRTRTPDGSMAWQLFSRKGLHGTYGAFISMEESHETAERVREYENALLIRQISFLETVQHHFSLHRLWHDPAAYRKFLRQTRPQGRASARVFRNGDLEECRV